MLLLEQTQIHDAFIDYLNQMSTLPKACNTMRCFAGCHTPSRRGVSLVYDIPCNLEVSGWSAHPAAARTECGTQRSTGWCV